MAGSSLGTAGPVQPMGYRQGTVVSFNPVTLENVISVGGALLANVPLLGVAEATTLVTGSVVGVMCVGEGWAIIGRLVTPGTAAAADAVSLLSAHTMSETVDAQETTSTTAFTDLTTLGPAVSVTVGPSGRVLAIWTSKIGWAIASASPPCGGAMSVELSGVNNIAASDSWRAAGLSQKGGVSFDNQHGTYTEQKVFEGLTPGETTFTAKYRAFYAPAQVDFQTRTLSVISL